MSSIFQQRKDDPTAELRELDEAISNVLESGGVVEMKRDGDIIEAIFISTCEMVTDISCLKPQLIILDTTFGSNKELFKLLKWVFFAQGQGRHVLPLLHSY